MEKTLGSQGSTHKLITNQGVKKFTTTAESKTVLDEGKISEDALWDAMLRVSRLK